jgi:DNA mismatch endonuclease (patch repair protein)
MHKPGDRERARQQVLDNQVAMYAGKMRPEVRKENSERMRKEQYKRFQDPLYVQRWAESLAKASLRQPKTNELVARLLQERDLKFDREFLLGHYRFDFAFVHTQVLLEVQGCFWHGCPKHFTVLSAAQKDQKRLDKSKCTYATNRGWVVCYIWEHDLPEWREVIRA